MPDRGRGHGGGGGHSSSLGSFLPPSPLKFGHVILRPAPPPWKNFLRGGGGGGGDTYDDLK